MPPGVLIDMRKSVLKKPHYAAMACAGVLAAASVFVHPFGVRILEKYCRNCHSEQTEWPWYSYVAPMSWLIEKDVHDARRHLNLSHWQEYDAQTQHDLPIEMAAVVRNGRMPLPRYTLLHPAAKPSPAEFDLIYQWARAQRRRLTASATRGVAR